MKFSQKYRCQYFQRDNECIDPDGYTCDAPTNCYTSSGATPKRIDYILYKSPSTFEVCVRECKPTMGRIEDKPGLNYSDHEALYAKFILKPGSRGKFAYASWLS